MPIRCLQEAVMRRSLIVFTLTFIAVMVPGGALGQDIASFEKRTTVKVLKNGLTVILCERPEAPVFSFFTLVDAGSVQDPQGQSGLAHMFEHMAFKGSDRIGSTNYAQERIALEKADQVYIAYDREDRKQVGRDPKKVEALHKAYEDAVKAADQYVIENRFAEIIEREGGVGLNASTSEDSYQYYYSFPINRLELWAYLESERFRHPVFREFTRNATWCTKSDGCALTAARSGAWWSSFSPRPTPPILTDVPAWAGPLNSTTCP